ncbi:acyl-CoA N-acyltransferase [Myxozyma melibiosi]|uniref:Histone acetyltransferase type B catalytic subunit n=1 Tax=Myxozyma melibiosi TaxID=54550 RepID=A0ABR1FCX6_9ASCO
MTSITLPEVWTADSNKALSVSLVNPDGTVLGKEFHPKFTYPIFGDAEAIYGYKDLSIQLKFGATDLAPFLNVSYSEKLDNAEALASVIEEVQKNLNAQEENWEDAEEEVAQEDGDKENEQDEKDDNGDDDEKPKNGDDPATVIKKFLPDDIFTSESDWLSHLSSSATEFTPPGTLLTSYPTDDSTFEVWKCPISDPLQQKINARMQIFVLFFVEAGSYIDASDDRWRIYTLYSKSSDGVYKFAGFTTVYSYLYYKDAKSYDSSNPVPDKDSQDFFNLQHRKRISQFLILPPFQGHHHGAHLYNALMDEFYADPLVKEVTVEDPNVAFDDLRDRCDIERLDRLGIFNDESFTDAPVSPEWIKFAREQSKIMPRQFERLVEMALLRRLKKSNARQYKAYRLQVKQRLYKHNREALKDLDRFERVDKLDETYRGVEEDYYRILQVLPAPEYVEPKITFRQYEEAHGRSGVIEKSKKEASSSGKGKGKKRAQLLEVPEESAADGTKRVRFE